MGVDDEEKENCPCLFGSLTNPTWIREMGKCQSDRSQITGRTILVGQLAPWVTWDIWHIDTCREPEHEQHGPV